MEQVLSKTKLELDDDFNIIDPEAELRKAEAIAATSSKIAALKSRRGWIMQDIYDIDQEIEELQETLKGYGVE